MNCRLLSASGDFRSASVPNFTISESRGRRGETDRDRESWDRAPGRHGPRSLPGARAKNTGPKRPTLPKLGASSSSCLPPIRRQRNRRYRFCSDPRCNRKTRDSSSDSSSDADSNSQSASSYKSRVRPKPPTRRRSRIKKRARTISIDSETLRLTTSNSFLKSPETSSTSMGSLASKTRNTTIHVTQIQETRLEVQGRRFDPKNRSRRENGERVTKTERVVSVTNSYDVTSSERATTKVQQESLPEVPDTGRYHLLNY